MYPLSTFGPMAIYKSDFAAVGGIEDTNSGRWGYEDTAFLHKVRCGRYPPCMCQYCLFLLRFTEKVVQLSQLVIHRTISSANRRLLNFDVWGPNSRT